MNRWKQWAGILGIFIAGVILGQVTSRLFFLQKIERFHRNGPQSLAYPIHKRLAEKLRLNAEQEKASSELFRRTFQKVQGFHQNRVQPMIQRIFEESMDELRDLLNEEQRERLKELRQPFPFLENPSHHRGINPPHHPHPNHRPPHPPPHRPPHPPFPRSYPPHWGPPPQELHQEPSNRERSIPLDNQSIPFHPPVTEQNSSATEN